MRELTTLTHHSTNLRGLDDNLLFRFAISMNTCIPVK